ncbi:helix-turn-helix domain-containing protein [Kurthia sibirica]|uniref:Mga helix-turn-helix domain-containing protein n=1 Tax=Kurthia sibirica TaxID=202750 RepID=A0A2U3ALD8_9BACL|nr:helix-turn-helix domain-containing protein [Kurthia sibirica]PWI25351.1 hypothetical protein DEX24_08405 [Kurthia sibirica]GEK35471.1 hypothetical protein KSI01_30040 [Kurthia sibirica]
MYKLLEKDERICLEILYYFSKHKKQNTIALKEISSDLGYDSRRLINHLEKLVEDIEEYDWHKEIGLVIQNDLLHIEIRDTFAVDFFESEYLLNSVLFKLCMDLYLNTFTNLSEFAQRNFISTSTIYRRVKKLKQILADFDIELHLLAPQYFIGKEYQIRYFFYSLISTAYYYNSEQTNDYISMKRTEIFDRFLQYCPQFPYASEVKLRILLDITVDRIQRGFIVEKESIAFSLTSTLYPYEPLYQFFKPICYENERAIINEATFFHFILNVVNIYSINELTVEQLSEALPTNEKSEKVDAVIMQFTEFFNCPLSNLEHNYIERNLYYIMKRSAIIRGSEHIESLQFNLTTVAEAHPYVSELLYQFFEYLEKELAIVLREDLKLQMFLVFREVIWKIRSPIKICMLSKISSSQQYYLREKLITELKLPIELVSKIDDSTEIVIADYSIQAFYDETIDFYFIPSFPDAEEWLNLIQSIQDNYHALIKLRIDE